MFTIFFIIVISIIFVPFIIGKIIRRLTNQSVGEFCGISIKKHQYKFSESGIITKFNRLVSKINKKNIDDIKFDLINLLDQYREIKVMEFSEAKHTLVKNLKNLEKQQVDLAALKSDVRNKLDNMIKTKSSDSEIGAELLYNIDKIDIMMASAKDSYENCKKNLMKLDNQVDMFKVNYEIKKAEVNNLLTKQIMNSCSDYKIDLTIDNLKTEFEDMINEQEINSDITSKIYDKNSINLSEYIEKYNVLIK